MLKKLTDFILAKIQPLIVRLTLKQNATERKIEILTDLYMR